MMLDIAETKSLYMSICDIGPVDWNSCVEDHSQKDIEWNLCFLFKEINLHDKGLSIGVTLWTAEPIHNSLEYIKISPFFTMAENGYHVSHLSDCEWFTILHLCYWHCFTDNKYSKHWHLYQPWGYHRQEMILRLSAVNVGDHHVCKMILILIKALWKFIKIQNSFMHGQMSKQCHWMESIWLEYWDLAIRYPRRSWIRSLLYKHAHLKLTHCGLLSPCRIIDI